MESLLDQLDALLLAAGGGGGSSSDSNVAVELPDLEIPEELMIYTQPDITTSHGLLQVKE